MKYRILLADNDTTIAETFRSILPLHNYDLNIVTKTANLLQEARQWQPDLIIIGKTSGTNALTLLKYLSQDAKLENSFFTLLVDQSGQDWEEEAFETGADGFWVKPLGQRSTLKRIEALLRRQKNLHSLRELTIGGLTINKDSYTVKKNDTIVQLTQMEADILWLLATHPHQVFSRQEISNQIVGLQLSVDSRSIDVHITYLRQKIGEHYLVTKRKRGYQFRPATEPTNGKH